MDRGDRPAVKRLTTTNQGLLGGPWDLGSYLGTLKGGYRDI